MYIKSDHYVHKQTQTRKDRIFLKYLSPFLVFKYFPINFQVLTKSIRNKIFWMLFTKKRILMMKRRMKMGRLIRQNRGV